MKGVLGRTRAEFYSIADSSTTATWIPILFAGGCWAHSQPYNGIGFVPIARKLRKFLSSMDGVTMLTLAEFHSMADSSTAAAPIPILFAGGCWAASQLHKGIKYVPTPLKPMKLLSSVEAVPWRNST